MLTDNLQIFLLIYLYSTQSYTLFPLIVPEQYYQCCRNVYDESQFPCLFFASRASRVVVCFVSQSKMFAMLNGYQLREWSSHASFVLREFACFFSFIVQSFLLCVHLTQQYNEVEEKTLSIISTNKYYKHCRFLVYPHIILKKLISGITLWKVLANQLLRQVNVQSRTKYNFNPEKTDFWNNIMESTSQLVTQIGKCSKSNQI